MITFQVTNQHIKLTNATPIGDTLVSGTIGEYICKFIFEDELEGYVKTAVFKPIDCHCECDEEEHSYPVLLDENDECIIPSGVLIDGFKLRIGIYRTAENKALPTIWSSPLIIRCGAVPNDAELPEDPTIIEQVLQQYAQIIEMVEHIEAAVVPAGGEIGQVLTKTGEADYEMTWEDATDAGTIDKILVNGEEQPIVDKTVDIPIPTATSELENDSDFVNKEYVDKIVSEVLPEVTEEDNGKVLEVIDGEWSVGEAGLNPDDVAEIIQVTETQPEEEMNRMWVNPTAQTITLVTPDDLENYLQLSGGKMTGSINMDNQSIENLPTAERDGQPVPYGQIPTTPLMTSTNLSYDGDAVTINKTFQNIKTGDTSTEEELIQLADSETAGLMSPTSVQALSDLQSRVESLEGTTVRLLYTDKNNPTQQEIQAFVESKGYTDPTKWAGIAVVITGTYHIWHYYSNDQIGWKDDGLDTVSQFTNEQAGIIKGSENDGQVYAEDDGTGSIVGWNELKVRVTNVENNKADDSALQAHIDDKDNPHEVTKAQVGLGNVANERQYSAENPPPYPVTSVAGKTGVVTLVKGDVGLGNVDNVKQYSANNPPPYPVTSVNNKTGDVNLTKGDVGLSNVDNVKQYSASNPPPADNNKADKVVGATNGDFAGLDATGNLTDSGYKADDFVTTTDEEPSQPVSVNADTLDFHDSNYFAKESDMSEVKNALSDLEQDKVDKTDYSPETKTADMTQPVGKDADGKLWTDQNGAWGKIVGNIEDQTDLIKKFDDYAKLSKLTVTMVGSQGNTPTGNTVQVYEVFPDGNEVLVASAVYGDTPVSFKLDDGLEYKVTGTTTVSGFYNPNTVIVDLTGDESITVTYFEIATPTSMQDVHNLIQLGVEEQVMNVGDVINVRWVSTNGSVYDVPATVAELGHTYIDHETGQPVKGVRFQFLKGFPDYPQFDAPERELATETTALADTYYYGTDDNNTFALLQYSEGDTIDYSAYTYIYHNSFRDTTFNILKYGNNLLEYSARLQWLNSAEPKASQIGVDGWWHSTHLGDSAPSQASTIDGLMHGFDKADFLDYVLDSDFNVSQNTVTANGSMRTLHGKFRDPMVVEVYGSPQVVGEGDNRYWSLWEYLCKNSPTNPLSAPSNGNCSARRVQNLENTSFSTVFLSSCYRARSYNVWYVLSSAGQLNDNNAANSIRSSPTFIVI